MQSLWDILHWEDEDAGTKSRFGIAMNEMAEKNDSGVMGQMHLINLRDLISRHKDPDKELERAEKIAEAVINETLDDGDVYTRGRNGAFYFLFSDMNEAAGELKCAVIAEKIARALRKHDPVYIKLVIETTAETVDLKSLKNAKAEKSAGKGLADGDDHERPSSMTREGKPLKRAIGGVTHGEVETADAKAAAPVDDEMPEPKVDAPSPEGMSVMYGTIWNVKTKLLTAYSCTLMVREADGRSVRFRFKHRAEHYRETLFAIDQYTLGKATARLRELLQSGQEILVVLPVHFMTVDQDASSLFYRQRLADLSEMERRHIVLEIVDLPHGLSGLWVGKIARTMRRVARTVMIRTSIDSQNLDSWRDTGVHAVGFDLGTLRIDQQALLPKLERFAEHAEESGLRTFVYGIDTISTAAMAVSAGIDYVEGAAVCAPVESIEHVRPFETEDLLAHLVP